MSLTSLLRINGQRRQSVGRILLTPADSEDAISFTSPAYNHIPSFFKPHLPDDTCILKSPRIDSGGFGNLSNHSTMTVTAARRVPHSEVLHANTNSDADADAEDDMLIRINDDPISEPPSPLVSLPSFFPSSSSSSDDLGARKPTAPYPVRARRYTRTVRASSSENDQVLSWARDWTRNTSASKSGTNSSTSSNSNSGFSLAAILILTSYFLLNLLLTLHNKLVLSSFPFPYLITSIHTLCTAFGVRFLRFRGAYVPEMIRMRSREGVVLGMFSVLYTMNIAASNVSLHLVSVPFHQVVRGMTPLFTIGLSAVLLKTRCSVNKWLSLVPVVVGVALATYGDYNFTTYGLTLTILGAVLAAFKTVLTSMLQAPRKPDTEVTRKTKSSPPSTHSRFSSRVSISAQSSSKGSTGSTGSILSTRLSLHPLDLLERLSSLASAQCLLFAVLGGELSGARLAVRGLPHSGPSASPTQPPSQPSSRIDHTSPAPPFDLLLTITLNALLALALNIASFYAARRTSPVAMSVAGNVKQVLTVLLAVVLFDLRLAPVNVLGVGLSLVGGAWYAWVECAERRGGSLIGRR